MSSPTALYPDTATVHPPAWHRHPPAWSFRRSPPVRSHLLPSSLVPPFSSSTIGAASPSSPTLACARWPAMRQPLSCPPVLVSSRTDRRPASSATHIAGNLWGTQNPSTTRRMRVPVFTRGCRCGCKFLPATFLVAERVLLHPPSC